MSILTVLLLPALRAQAENITFPPDARIHNVRDYGAKGDGTTDDTAALQKAFRENSGKHMETVYFPNGTYLISDTVWFAEWIFVQGQSRDGTVIRLKDTSRGFDDYRHPRQVVGTTNPEPSPSCRNTNFSTHLLNVTIDTGKGNPGANGIELLSNNGGGLDTVTIRAGDGTGAIGIDMTRPGPGPALCKNVRVEGFNYGLSIASDVYCSTFEDLVLVGQKIAGIRNLNHPVAIRRLMSTNAGPAILNVGLSGQIVLLDSELLGGAADAFAIDNCRGGSLYARNLKTAGYQAAVLAEKGKTFPSPIEEYTSGEVRTLWPCEPRGLNLPIRDTPELPWDDPATWVSVKTFADKAAGGDWAPAIQAAIDSGKSTVYFPHARYAVRSTLHVRGSVRVLQGCGSLIEAGDELKDQVVFAFDRADKGTVWFDRLSFGTKTWAMPAWQVEHASPATLVVLHSRWMSYRSRSGAGDLFVDDMCGAPWQLAAGQKAWFRQLDIESKDTKFQNNGALLWVLGIKAEGTGTNLVNTGGARTEILGGEIYPAAAPAEDAPMWVNTDAALSLVHTIFWGNTLYIRDTRKGVTRELTLPRGHRFIDFFVDRPD